MIHFTKCKSVEQAEKRGHPVIFFTKLLAHGCVQCDRWLDPCPDPKCVVCPPLPPRPFMRQGWPVGPK